MAAGGRQVVTEKGNILGMSNTRQWLDLGLEALPPARAQRVRLFRLLLMASGRIRRQLDQRLAAEGLTTQQAAVLQFIEAQARPPGLTAVAQALGMTHQNVKQLVLVLQRKGFVQIEADPQDGRRRCLVLTDLHRRTWQRRNPGDFDHVERWSSALTDVEVGQLVAMLARLARSTADSTADSSTDS